MTNCIFCDIVDKTAPAEILYEDDEVIVIKNIRPLAPVHWLILPKQHIVSMNELAPEDAPLAGKLLLTTKEMAQQAGIAQKGYRTAINTGEGGGQTVFHLHVHLLGGKPVSEELMRAGL